MLIRFHRVGGESVEVGIACDVSEQLDPTRGLVHSDALVVVAPGLPVDLGEKPDDYQRLLGDALVSQFSLIDVGSSSTS